MVPLLADPTWIHWDLGWRCPRPGTSVSHTSDADLTSPCPHHWCHGWNCRLIQVRCAPHFAPCPHSDLFKKTVESSAVASAMKATSSMVPTSIPDCRCIACSLSEASSNRASALVGTVDLTRPSSRPQKNKYHRHKQDNAKYNGEQGTNSAAHKTYNHQALGTCVEEDPICRCDVCDCSQDDGRKTVSEQGVQRITSKETAPT